jgi:type II secretory pathway pseudopilin PulG
MKAFSFLEIILTVAIIGIIAGASVPVYLSYQIKNNLDMKVSVISQSWRQAQLLAQNSKNDSAWGVKIEVDKVVVFSGDSYALRDPALDIIFTTANNLVVSGNDEIVFSKFYGWSNLTGATTMTAPDGQIKSLSLNEKGTVN